MNEHHRSVCRVRHFQALHIAAALSITHLAEYESHRTRQSLAPSWVSSCLQREAMETREQHSNVQLPQPLQPPLPRTSNKKTRNVQLEQLPTRN